MNIDDSTSPDLLSDLPLSIIKTILTSLPIRDAVRTSLLSSKWRYRWASIPELFFSDSCVDFSPDKNIAEGRLINFITYALLLHQGHIHRFKIWSRPKVLHGRPVVDQWMLFLSRNDVRELILELGNGELVRAPSCLFSCKYLTHLELSQYKLDPPPSFKGFPLSKTLILREGSVAAEAVGSLISNFPLLENLTLSLDHYDGWNLNMCAPNLKDLCLEGEFKKVCLESPRVEAMIISLYVNPDEFQEDFEQSLGCNYVKFLGGVPNLISLCGRAYFTKHLSIGIDQWRPQMTHDHLKIIELVEVCFEDTNEILVVIRLITNSPNLQKLDIYVRHGALGPPNRVPGVEAPVMEFWKSGRSSDYTLKRLKTVTMIGLIGAPHEMEFIQFLLRNSPVLEEMYIQPTDTKEKEVDVLLELLQFQRASPLAEIFFIKK